MTRTYRQPGGLALLVSAAAIGLAACSGGSTSAPAVASLPASSASVSSGGASSSPGADPSSSGSSSAGGATGNAIQLLDEWAACMRAQGDTGQADPTIDSNEVIHIVIPFATSQTANFGQEAHESSGPCGHYLQQASKILLGGQPSPPPPSLSQQLAYARCMRANGVSKYPDPNGSASTNVRNLDPNGPTFQNAEKVCDGKYGTLAYGASEPPGSIEVGPASQPSGRNNPVPGNRSGTNG
jgi:hypothetical protein